jgi:hypothetical protein
MSILMMYGAMTLALSSPLRHPLHFPALTHLELEFRMLRNSFQLH